MMGTLSAATERARFPTDSVISIRSSVLPSDLEHP